MVSKHGKMSLVGMFGTQKRIDYSPTQREKVELTKIPDDLAKMPINKQYDLSYQMRSELKRIEAMESPRQTSPQKAKTSAFLTTTRDQLDVAKWREIKEKPAVGRYNINYKRIDSQKNQPNPYALLSPAFLATVRVEPGDGSQTGRGWLSGRAQSAGIYNNQNQRSPNAIAGRENTPSSLSNMNMNMNMNNRSDRIQSAGGYEMQTKKEQEQGLLLDKQQQDTFMGIIPNSLDDFGIKANSAPNSASGGRITSSRINTADTNRRKITTANTSDRGTIFEKPNILPSNEPGSAVSYARPQTSPNVSNRKKSPRGMQQNREDKEYDDIFDQLKFQTGLEGLRDNSERQLNSQMGKTNLSKDAFFKQQYMFKSGSANRENIVPRNVRDDEFYITHDTNIEVNSQKPRTPQMKMTLADKNNQASMRLQPTLVDHMYNVNIDAVSKHRPDKILSDFGRETSRDSSATVFTSMSGKHAGGVWIWGSDKLHVNADAIYKTNDELLSKRRRVPSASISKTGFGEPLKLGQAPLQRNNQVPVYHSTSEEINSDINRLTDKVRPKTSFTLAFGKPKTQRYLLGSAQKQRQIKNKHHPMATIDENGNELPHEMYDVNINPIHTRFPDGLTQFGVSTGRSPQMQPLTAELDYQPDISAATYRTGAEINKEQRDPEHNIPQSYRSPKKLAPSLKQAWGIDDEQQPEPQQSVNQDQLESSPRKRVIRKLPLSLVWPSMLGPDKSNYSVISAGTREHVGIIDFSSQTGRAVDLNEYKDAATDKFYDAGGIIGSENRQSRWGHQPIILLKKQTSRQNSNIITHTPQHMEANSAGLESPSMKAVLPASRSAFIGKMSTEVDMNGKRKGLDTENVTGGVPFYDSNYGYVKRRIPNVIISKPVDS
ncbi:MAG: hypothetical protein EZS28_025701 [Streblomastix strix]|uniref:Uncharacterized protein n=1 Tax=Streblomastix strix TaxID=222440 RepID=A0A5J4V8F5_9EUKA|nr:MAG: hypothetical protein EZS28_025701 [Streblomastix strix]